MAIRGHVGGTPVALDLARDAGNAWRANGAPVPALAGCMDVDLGFSPSTNLLPIRRLQLDLGASAPVRAAWVRFPQLTLEVLEQVYTRTAATSYRYESAGAKPRELRWRRAPMTRRSKIWLTAGGVWTVINVGGAGYAAMMGEPLHAASHVVAFLVGAVVLWWLAPPLAAAHSQLSGSTLSGVRPGPFTDRLTDLEQSIDAVAIEVERIGEGQREMTRLFADEGVARDDAPRAAEPTKIGHDRSSS